MTEGKPSMPPGSLGVALIMLLDAAGGVWMALAHTSTLYLVCGAWFKSRRS
ncbi:hypothetical protein [Amycolatopsis sp. cg9]|uniref:hypothetical protein n=1 Tax=Amycolatopsis sp. cg9 TaxID=3238801 RepID=UPI003525B36F